MRDKLLACVVALLLYPLSASAETGAVVVVGTLNPGQRDIVEVAATDVLRSSSWSLIEPPLTDRERDAVAACTATLDRPWACASQAAKRGTLDRLVVIEVRPDKTQNGQLAITAQVLAAGNGVATIEGTHCAKQCSYENLRNSTTEIVTLTLKTASERNPSSVLVVRSKPDGAAIKLDGRMVGTTDQTIATVPGSHTVLLQRDGYEPATRTVNVTEAETAAIDVTLVAVNGANGNGIQKAGTPTASSRVPSRLLPAVTIGIGAAVFVGGLVYSRTRDKPDASTFEQPEYVNSKLGIGVSIAGGVVTVAGAVWLWSRWPSKRSTPTISVTPRATTLGWAAAF